MEQAGIRYYPGFLSILMMCLYGCIEQYYPGEEELKTGTLVIIANLAGKPGNQSIQISRSSTISYPTYDPVMDCYVEVIREDGETAVFSEWNPGYYHGDIGAEFLENESYYKLLVITAGGNQYESGYEQLHPPVEIDSIYWEREDKQTADADLVLDGVQFYLDFEIDTSACTHMRWELEETYQIHNPEYTSYVFGKDRRFMEVPDSSSWRTCWITLGIPQFFTLDLKLMDPGSFREMPLNYVSSETRRLHIRYSLMVRQFSISESAFFYWDELRKNLQTRGGLFDKQPALTPGNICNVEDEKEVILGYFSISGVSEKRVFVDRIPEMNLKPDPEYCYPGDYPPGLFYFPSSYLPVYLSRVFIEGLEYRGEVNKYCVDCRAYKGSSHRKPDYW
jgi:hypothetical protein